ncbi:hypothetical protein CH333_09235 [candidate division WOR-3 bacterium JGI_Cruoil_03_44_89]|uniref:Uncharacterized protein n=1 Tax=candidate division WOR-3 bacterium JGI_Cruoil_03_44_89 TaxID=1973748 RepID=A0A235BNC7_UNCW3|nr:MAG: hypothetical protein CH333_09235 [candidate division WOR-3 bacterium JGI_Cruoil_03_44_89]
MKLKKEKIGMVIVMVTFAFLIGCGRGGPSGVLETASLSIEVGHRDVDSTLWFIVSDVVLRVSGYNFSPIVDTQSVDSTIFSVDVPTGNDRVFTAFGIDTAGVAYLWGRKDTTVAKGDTTRISIIISQLLQTAGDSILILRDSLPWGLSCTDTILDSLGAEYTIVPSDSFADLILDPLVNTIIIPSDQPQEFYNRYRIYVTKFNNFIYDGGVMFFSACDRGWNGGDISEATFLFPSGVTLDTICHADTLNLVTGIHAIVSNLDTLRGYFASYTWFTDCPPFAQVLTVTPDTVERPTLLLYQHGSGLVLLSSQPLEYAYSNGTGEDNIGILLPRILGFLCDDDKLH